METILKEMLSGLPDAQQLVRTLIRLLLAMFAGAIIGAQREYHRKPAGLRTHILVSLSATLIVLGPLEFGMASADISRIIQGLITGISFLGGGVILKRQEGHEIHGLTTAAGILMTAAVGLIIGLGRLGLAIISLILTLMTLSLLRAIEDRLGKKERKDHLSG